MTLKQEDVPFNKAYYFAVGYVWAYAAYIAGLQKWAEFPYKAKWRKSIYRQGAKEGWQVASKFRNQVKWEILKVTLPRESDDFDDFRIKVLGELITIFDQHPSEFEPLKKLNDH